MNKSDSTKKYRIILLLYVIVAILAPVLSNERPLYVSIEGKSYFPAFSTDAYFAVNGSMQLMNNVDWKNINHDVIIFAPIRWNPVHSDLQNIYASPFDKQYKIVDGKKTELNFSDRHFLGTGRLGNDTFADLIHGTRMSLLIGFFAMFISVLIGTTLGGIAGYCGDTSVRISRLQSIASILLIVPAWFYAFHIRSNILSNAFHTSGFNSFVQLFISILLFIIILIIPLLIKAKNKNRLIFVPVDSIISRIIEVFVALPKLILILTIAAIFHSSSVLVIFVIGLTSWTEIARVTRAKLLQLKKENFVEAARASGLSPSRVLFTHILPNIKDQIISIAIFIVANAIMIETGLSFLGIGVSPDTPTWGQMMYEARQHYSAWWLVVFSGIAIACLLYSLFVLSQRRNNSADVEKIILTNS
jgi:ABC-type dipeptide/oligopeptide/nickel transport system permease subunit